MRQQALPILFVLILLSVGCSDRKPARIVHSEIPQVVVGRDPVPLRGAVMNKTGKILVDQQVSYSVAQTDLAEVSPSGELRCLKTGDATVLISGGGLSEMLVVKCRLVARLNAPAELRLTVGKEPPSFRPTAIDEGGSALTDVTVSSESSDPAVVKVSGTGLEPIGMGTAVVTSAAGGITATTEVVVAEIVTSEPLVLSDGASQTWTLQEGDYEVDVEVKPNDKISGVVLSWVGSNCGVSPERQVHHVRCHVPGTATVTASNPTALGLGSGVTGYINIYRVP